MLNDLIDSTESLERQNEKLRKINDVLMRRIERSTEISGTAYAQFQRAATLEEEVRRRTRELEKALDLLNLSNAQLAQANKETEAARSNLTNAIEAIQEGFAFFDPMDRLVMCNSRFGLHLPDVRDAIEPGLSFTEYVKLVSESPNLTLPEGVGRRQYLERRLARHKEEHVIFNVRIVGRRWVQVSEHRTPDGGTVILQTDVTDIMRLERQENERILDDKARTIQATLEHLDQGVCIFDNQARLVGWNQHVGMLLSLPAHLFRIGTRFNTLIERFPQRENFSDGVTVEKIESWVAREKKRPNFKFEIAIGKSRTLAVDARVLPDNGFVISFSDVSAERAAVKAIREANELLEARVAQRTLELEDALAEAERANTSKSRFVAAASHDLLQPLSAAKLYLSSVASGELDSATAEVILKTRSALIGVEKILEALLDISKLDSGKAAIHVAPIRIDPVLHQLRDELMPKARKKGLDLRVVPTNSVVLSDATYLRRILQNLMSNAVRYTESGKVLVGARKHGASVRLEVWDTGPGIPEQEQDSIFREFRRLDAAASAAEGMGLGLAIVERACALLNHPLELHSAVGRGTGFIVTFPLARQELTAPRTSKRNLRTTHRDLSDLIVLLIENDGDVRNAMAVALEKRWGAGVLTASSTAEAMRALTELGVPPDVIVADYQLDGDDTGLVAIAEVKKIYGDVPACIISADRSPALASACAEADHMLLHKPVDFAILGEFLSAGGGD